MKKKIKDLTIEEIDEICEKQGLNKSIVLYTFAKHPELEIELKIKTDIEVEQ